MKVRIIEVPMDFGANRRGVDMGPSAMRLAGLKEGIASLGHEPSEDLPRMVLPMQEFEQEGDPKLKFLEPILEGCRELSDRVEAAMEGGAFPLVVGGDHSIALGTFAGLSAYYRGQGLRWGTVWIDAHGDFNTPETSPSGNIHGMILAASAGLGPESLTHMAGPSPKIDPRHVVIIGARDLDPGEKANLKRAEIKVITMLDIDRLGMADAVDSALEYLEDRVDAIHVSLDMDSMDPRFAPGVGTPVRGGLSFRELDLLMESLSGCKLVRSAEVVEVNPILDVRNQTARTAVEALLGLLGKGQF